MTSIINFVGDIALFKKYEQLQIDPFKNIWLPESDFNIGNFEFIIPNNRKKNYYDVQDAYKCSYDFFESLEINKFNLLSLANNHSMDYGIEGANDTIRVLHKKGVQHFGFSKTQEYNINIFDINKITFCIIGTIKTGRWSKENNSGCGTDDYNVENIVKLITRNKPKVDHIIVFPHWGSELVDIPNPKHIRDARIFIEKGASAVIGHHPHVSQGIERYQGGIIAYSLGSFIYIPSEELGYDGLQERDVSICINITFDKKSISKYSAFLYKHNKTRLVPELATDDSLKKYFDFINKNIHNKKFYYKKVRSILLKREYYSFIERFKDNPFKTLIHYLNYLKLRHLMMIFRR